MDKVQMIKTISSEKKDIGGLLKKSKQHFKWRLELDGRLVTIEVLSSKLSGRRRVFRDGQLLDEKQIFESVYTHNFKLGEHTLVVMQHGENFELRIDNVSFTHLHAQAQVKKAFVYEEASTQPQQKQFQFDQPPPKQFQFDQVQDQPKQQFNFDQQQQFPAQNKSNLPQQAQRRPKNTDDVDDLWGEVRQAKNEVIKPVEKPNNIPDDFFAKPMAPKTQYFDGFKKQETKPKFDTGIKPSYDVYEGKKPLSLSEILKKDQSKSTEVGFNFDFEVQKPQPSDLLGIKPEADLLGLATSKDQQVSDLIDQLNTKQAPFSGGLDSILIGSQQPELVGKPEAFEFKFEAPNSSAGFSFEF